MRQLSGSKLALALALFGGVALARADETTPPSAPVQPPESSTASISREVKDIFEKSAKAVVKIRGTDQHGDLAGTGFFIDPAGMLYTAFAVGGDADDLTIEFNGKKYPARRVVADVRSGIAILQAEVATPALP